MNLPLILFLAALLALVLFVFMNPDILPQAARRFMRVKSAYHEATREVGLTTEPRPASYAASVDDQFRDLRVSEFFTYDDGNGGPIEYEVTGVGSHQAQNRQGKNFTPRGDVYRLYAGEGFMMLERPDGWFLFNEATVLQGEEAKEFNPFGELFGDKQHNQVPRSVTFDWRGVKLAILDTGYTQYVHGAGKSHITDGKMVKYMLAERDDGRIFYLENQQNATARVWFGTNLGNTLEGKITKVLRAST